MESTAPETREKIAHWLQEGLTLFPYLPALVQGDGAAAARSTDLERECERLRHEAGELRRELDELRREHDRLRAERDEVTQAFAKLVDTVQPINQIAQKLGVRRSPFDRDPRPPAPGAPPASRP
jgi:hypothetical protein